MKAMPRVGVLALQGDVAEHRAALARAGVVSVEIRTPADLADLDGIVLPGGESTTMLKLLELQRLFEPLGSLLRSGLPVLGTCAGAILLARSVEPAQRSFAVLDIDVCRNGYGRQIHSGTFELEGDLPAGTRGVFIRAPRIVRAGAGVEVLARRGGDAVLVRSGPVLAACFHPELQDAHPLTRTFIDLVENPQRREIRWPPAEISP